MLTCLYFSKSSWQRWRSIGISSSKKEFRNSNSCKCRYRSQKESDTSNNYSKWSLQSSASPSPKTKYPQRSSTRLCNTWSCSLRTAATMIAFCKNYLIYVALCNVWSGTPVLKPSIISSSTNHLWCTWRRWWLKTTPYEQQSIWSHDD